MFSKSGMKQSTGSCSVERLQEALDTADAVLIGAGAGLSTSAGLTYSGERFERYFSDFYRKYGISDMYSGGFYPYDTLRNTGPGGAVTFFITAMWMPRFPFIGSCWHW